MCWNLTPAALDCVQPPALLAPLQRQSPPAIMAIVPSASVAIASRTVSIETPSNAFTQPIPALLTNTGCASTQLRWHLVYVGIPACLWLTRSRSGFRLRTESTVTPSFPFLVSRRIMTRRSGSTSPQVNFTRFPWRTAVSRANRLASGISLLSRIPVALKALGFLGIKTAITPFDRLRPAQVGDGIRRIRHFPFDPGNAEEMAGQREIQANGGGGDTLLEALIPELNELLTGDPGEFELRERVLAPLADAPSLLLVSALVRRDLLLAASERLAQARFGCDVRHRVDAGAEPPFDALRPDLCLAPRITGA